MSRRYSLYDIDLPDNPMRVGDEDYEPVSYRYERDEDAEHERWVDEKIAHEQKDNNRTNG